MTAVSGTSIARHSSHCSDSGFGAGPVRAQVCSAEGDGAFGRCHDVATRARRRHRHQDVAGPAVRLDLSSEHLFRAVIVEDRGERRRLAVQRNRGERASLAVIPPDDLGGQMLGLGGAPTVPDSKQPPAVEQPFGEPGAPAVGRRELRREAVQRRGQCRDVVEVGYRDGSGRRRRHPTAPASIADLGRSWLNTRR